MLEGQSEVCSATRTGKSVVAVVVTYNRKELLLQCLAKLQAQEGIAARGASLRVLVVDNASTDGTGESLAVLPSVQTGDITYYNTGANLGGAGGFNFGMRKAVEIGCDYVWVMDDDCMVHPDSLAELLEADKQLKGEYGWLSSVVRWKDGSLCKMNVQRHPLLNDITDFSPELQPCTLASFVSLFVPVRVVRQFGLPIKDFFIWTDDWEFTRRISRELPCYVAGKSVVTHASANNGAGTIATDTPDRLDRYKLVYRNDVVLYRREGSKGYLYLIARGLYHSARVLFGSGGSRARKLGIIWKSTFAGFRFHPEIERI